MCLSTVYELRGGEERLVSEFVSSLKIGDGTVTFTDIVGTEQTLTGILRSIDLIKNIILVDAG